MLGDTVLIFSYSKTAGQQLRARTDAYAIGGSVRVKTHLEAGLNLFQINNVFPAVSLMAFANNTFNKVHLILSIWSYNKFLQNSFKRLATKRLMRHTNNSLLTL